MEQSPLNWTTLHPKDCIQVTQRVWLTQRELQFVTQLYVPFLGTKATALYLVLLGELSPNTYMSEMIRLADLLAMVNLGIPDFYQARIRLEAVGLLKTYAYEDETTVGKVYTLELQAPASPSLFFKDALLATMLLNQVGHQRFESLKKQYLRPADALYGEELTASYEEGFQAPYNLTQYRRDVASERGMVQDVRQQEPFTPTSDMDWELLTDLLKSQFVREDALTPEVKRTMESLRLSYGLSEREIAQYAIFAADLSAGVIDSQELFDVVMNASQELAVSKRQSQEKEVSSQPVQEESNPMLSPTETAQPTPKADQLQLLIRLANERAPYDFLTSIKEQKKGYVSKGEQQLILDLMSVSQLPAPVINILIHYTLVAQNKKNFTRAFVDAIANDWAQAGLKTAQDAIDYVRNREKQKQAAIMSRQSNASKQRFNNKKQGRVETVPDWAKQENTTREQPVDDTTLKDLQAQIASLKTSKTTK